MTCPDCERYKESAKNWRHKAYELSGHPLPWDRGDTWVGLTENDFAIWKEPAIGILRWAEATLKEKNT